MQQPQVLQAPPTSEIKPEPIRQGMELVVNGKRFRHTGDEALPLLWYLRDVLRLTGAKYGCDEGECGFCTVLVDGKAAQACRLTMGKLANKHVTTIEGLGKPDGSLHPLQQAWIDEDAVLCGYCQPGQLMAAADLIARKPDPSDADIDRIGTLCRCGSYPRVRKAIKRAAKAMRDAG